MQSVRMRTPHSEVCECKARRYRYGTTQLKYKKRRKVKVVAVTVAIDSDLTTSHGWPDFKVVVQNFVMSNAVNDRSKLGTFSLESQIGPLIRGYRITCARWVARNLMDAHKESRLQISQQLKLDIQSQNDIALSESIRLLPLTKSQDPAICRANYCDFQGQRTIYSHYSDINETLQADWDRWRGRGRRLRAANQLRVNRTALPFSYPHVTPQSQSLPSNRFVRFTL
ncbi:hypothetical protein J6590_054738 [Homalodisca vitripennis]|nr:hypothetical protein J6590_054738 [Homalodisca vitripennis]